MRFGIFYEHQLPRPWDDDSEHRLLQDALEQVEIADRAGFDYVWEVEHHFVEEYSHSSAPEVFLAAASQRTERKEPFAGWESEFIRMPPRNVVPKPLQRPHPPLWVACSRRETIHFAARKGIGALSFSFVEPEDAGKWVAEYYDLIASEECVPAGFAVNPNVTVVLPMMCHEDEQTAIERGIDGAHFFGYSLAHYYGITPHEPARTDVFAEFQARSGSTVSTRCATSRRRSRSRSRSSPRSAARRSSRGSASGRRSSRFATASGSTCRFAAPGRPASKPGSSGPVRAAG